MSLVLSIENGTFSFDCGMPEFHRWLRCVSHSAGTPKKLLYREVLTYINGKIPSKSKDWEASAPKAYLNYILFDEDFNLVDFGFDQISEDAEQVGSTPVIPHDHLSLHVKVQQKGYLYVYLSNEQPVQTNVYFDDFRIVHHTGVEQIDDYYPFGVSYNTFVKQSAVPNDFGYNSKEKQGELDLGWIDYGARMYMADIGKWFASDPLADKNALWSPYNYVVNNPISNIDPDGMDWAQWGSWGGAGADRAAQLADESGATDWMSYSQPVSAQRKDEHVKPTDPIPGIRRIRANEDVSDLIFLELHGHIDLGLQFELSNTPMRNFGKLDLASVRVVQINLRLYYNHRANEILIDILTGSSSLVSEIASNDVKVYSSLALGFFAGGEVNMSRSLSEFNFMWSTGEASSYYRYDASRGDSASGSLSIFSYNDGPNPTISFTYGGSAALGLGFDGSVSLHVPLKFFSR